MKVAAGPSFRTDMQFNGVLPSMPLQGMDLAALKTLVSGFNAEAGAGDSYGAGKTMGKLAAMAPIADLAGDAAKRDLLVGNLKKSLESWLTAGGNQQLFYNKTWSSLVAYPASYGSDTRLSDHHFHFGYFIMGAAVVAQYDPAWAKRDKWGGMVEMLIREVNSWDDAAPLFGRFRYYDAYEGHGWADGMGFDRGNNQESSSEAMNCNAGNIQWGIHTGNKAIRDMGIFMYVNETRAIEQYWFDVDDAVFPSAFSHSAVGILWSNGGAYGTWFSAEKGAIHGINILPIAAGSLYPGRRPDHIVRNFAEGSEAYNATDAAVTVAFTDGFRMDVPARTQATRQGPLRAIAVLDRAPGSKAGGGRMRNGIGYSAGYAGFPAGAAVYDLGGRLLSGAHAAQAAKAGEDRPRAYPGVYLMLPSPE